MSKTRNGPPLEASVRGTAGDRRQFLKASLGAVAASLLPMSCSRLALPRRNSLPNPFVLDGKPLLVVVIGDDPATMIEAGLEALGGMRKLASRGKEALLKPNYVVGRPYPITTALDFTSSLVGYLKKVGLLKIGIYESPGSRLFTPMRPETNMEILGVIAEARKLGVEIVAGDLFARDEFCLVYDPSWSMKTPVGVHKRLIHAGLVINIPVLKRHSAAGMTCALKNHFGSVMMADRLVAHKQEGKGFDRRLVEFADAVRPELTLVDARSILARSGPENGDVVSGVRRMILSGDMVAVDAYCANLLAEHDATFSPEMISEQLRHAQSLGLGQPDLSQVQIVEVTT